jgi:hypothetical protein
MSLLTIWYVRVVSLLCERTGRYGSKEHKTHALDFSQQEQVLCLTLFNNKGTCIGTQSVVKRHQYHAVAVRRLLGEDPLGAILRVDPDEGGTRSESLRHHPRAEVLGPEKGLVVVQPLVGFVVGFPPAQTGTVI